MDNTVNETWIDKLIDELVDTKDEVSRLSIKEDKFESLLSLIFNNARLDYSGESLRLENDDAVFEYLRAIYPRYYKERLDELIEESKKLAEAKAKEAKGKKEA